MEKDKKKQLQQTTDLGHYTPSKKSSVGAFDHRFSRGSKVFIFDAVGRSVLPAFGPSMWD